MNYVIEALSRRHDRDSFDCGEVSLNDFLKRFARQNDAKGLGRTFVAVRPGEEIIRGYDTLSSGSIEFDNVPDNLPRYPVPVVHLGRLEVDKTAKGDGLGKLLLIDAIRRALNVARELDIFAIEVYALSDSARSFYIKFGFVELLDDRKHLYLPIKTARLLGLE